MKAKFGMVVTDGRGKIGGHVASKNRAGSYFRTKVSPVNPQSSSQLTSRNRLTTFSQAWSGLTQAQRDAWNAAVSDYARTDVFGDLRNPTGFNLFQRLNNNLANCGVAQINVPPLPGATDQLVLGTLTYAVGVAALSQAYTGTISAGNYALVFATAPQSPGVNFVKSEFRQIDVLNNADVTPVDLLAAYTAKFGGVGQIGQKIFIKFRPINGTTGQAGTDSQASQISVA